MATQKKTRAPRTPSNETKAQKFVRLGEARVTKAVKALRNIARLGGAGYERTEEQRKSIVGLLQAEVDSIEAALAPRKEGEKKAEGPVIKL